MARDFVMADQDDQDDVVIGDQDQVAIGERKAGYVACKGPLRYLPVRKK